jgi:hypothetical protein
MAFCFALMETACWRRRKYVVLWLAGKMLPFNFHVKCMDHDRYGHRPTHHAPKAKPAFKQYFSMNSYSGDMTDERTLREIADRACKKVYIGAAVLPKPLFVFDYDEDNGEVNGDEVSCCGLHFMFTS